MEREKKRRKGKRKDTLVYDDIHWLIYALQNALQRTLHTTHATTHATAAAHPRQSNHDVLPLFSPSFFSSLTCTSCSHHSP